MADPVGLDERQRDMWRAFVDMRHQLDRALDEQLAEHGLSSADFTVLVELSEAPGHAVRVRDLGEQIDWESSRLAHQLRRMEGRGLVQRGEHPSDRRGTLVHITDAGASAARRATPGHAGAVRRFFVGLLSDSELELVTLISHRVCRAVRDGR